jgi:hypothetical protein
MSLHFFNLHTTSKDPGGQVYATIRMSSQHTLPPQIATKQYYATESLWEAKIGYYRAIRRGPFIFISGTTVVDPSSATTKVLYSGSAKAQAHSCPETRW